MPLQVGVVLHISKLISQPSLGLSPVMGPLHGLKETQMFAAQRMIL